jgi:hypothetical protein
MLLTVCLHMHACTISDSYSSTLEVWLCEPGASRAVLKRSGKTHGVTKEDGKSSTALQPHVNVLTFGLQSAGHTTSYVSLLRLERPALGTSESIPLSKQIIDDFQMPKEDHVETSTVCSNKFTYLLESTS